MRIQLIVAAAALFLTTACHGVDSTAVDTEDMRAHLSVVSDGYGMTEVTAELKPQGDSFGFVDLVAGEQLRVYAQGYDARLAERWFDYHAHIPADRGGTEFQVRLERSYGTHAPDSWVQLPTSFDFFPLRGVWSLSWDTLPIEWDRLANDPMKITIDGPCISEFEQVIPAGRDSGVFLVRPGDLHIHDSWDGEACTLEIEAERVRRGRLDRAFAGGHIEARQKRTTDVTVVW